MFSGDFKESKDKEIVIEDTIYEEFKTFIQFLYFEEFNKIMVRIDVILNYMKNYNKFQLNYVLIPAFFANEWKIDRSSDNSLSGESNSVILPSEHRIRINYSFISNIQLISYHSIQALDWSPK